MSFATCSGVCPDELTSPTCKQTETEAILLLDKMLDQVSLSPSFFSLPPQPETANEVYYGNCKRIRDLNFELNASA